MTNLEPITMHPFEAAGLGIAPFRCTGMSEKVYQSCPGAPVQPGGSCDYCSTGIRYCCHIRSSDGKEFIVGTDCVRKIERADNRLMGQVEREIAKMKAAKKAAEREAKAEARRLEREAELQRQRERNGGQTDAEVLAAERLFQETDLTRRMIEENLWLLEVLDAVPYASEFVDGMKQQLQRRPARDLSERCQEILRDIYAKSGGARRNSKAYIDAAEIFDTTIKA